MVMSPSSAASDGLLITKVASLGPPLLGTALLNALYTRTATTALASLRAGTPVTLREVQSPCAFCHGDRVGLWREKTLARLEALPSLWLDALSRRGLSPREKPLARLRQAWGASPGLESMVLSKISWSVVGLGRPARGTLVSTVPTVAPRAHDGHAEVVDGCARDHDLLGFNGRRGGARHILGSWALKPARDDGAVTPPIT